MQALGVEPLRAKAGLERGEVRVDTACPVFTSTPLGCTKGMERKKKAHREAGPCQVIPGRELGREEEPLTGKSSWMDGCGHKLPDGFWAGSSSLSTGLVPGS